MGLAEIRQLKEQALLPKQPKRYVIPKISERKKKQILENSGKFKEDVKLNKWFVETRIKLTGFCQCGCALNSQKYDDKFYKFSCCHLFPKSIFKSIMYHRDNYVERAFWGGHHSVMDDTSMDRWVEFRDWQNIKNKFNILDPLIDTKEKTHKFYKHLQHLVQSN